MRPIFTNHVSHPIRSRFSAFSFSVSKPSIRGTERIADETSTMKPFPSTSKKPFPSNDPSRNTTDRPTNQETVDVGARDGCSLYWSEPWGQNIGAVMDMQPWGQNIGAGDRSLGWELEIVPVGTPAPGPPTDGRVEKWAGL